MMHHPQWKSLNSARYHLTQATERAIEAQALFGTPGWQSYETWMHQSLAKAVNALGYDLVKRERETA